MPLISHFQGRWILPVTLALGIVAISVAPVAADSREFALAFEPGKSYGLVSNAVVRGDRDFFLFDARPGQRITIAITSVEDNAAFDLEVRRGDAWLPLPEAVEQRAWYGPLPPSESNNYRIAVGGTRGNASYDLFVGISVVEWS